MHKVLSVIIWGISLLLCSCSSNIVPESKVSWDTSFNEAKQFYPNAELSQPSPGYNRLTVTEGDNELVFSFSEQEGKLQLETINLPNATVDELKQYYEKSNDVHELGYGFYYLNSGVETIFIGPENEGAGIAVLHSCPQLDTLIEQYKENNTAQGCKSTKQFGEKAVLNIWGVLSYGIPPLEGYYLEANRANIRKAEEILMRQFYQRGY